MRRPPRHRAGFTLVELFVLTALFACLAFTVAEFHRATSHRVWVKSMAMSSDGSTVAACFEGHEELTQIWDVASGQSLGVIPHETAPWITTIALSAVGKQLLIATHDSKSEYKAQLYDTRTLAAGPELTLTGDAQTLCVSADARRAATWTSTGLIEVWSLADGSRIRSFGRPISELRADPTSGVTMSPDGETVAEIRTSGDIVLWDVATDREKRRLHDTAAPGHTVEFSADGKRLASTSNMLAPQGGTQATLSVWDIESGARELLDLGSKTIGAVGFLADGRLIAVVDDQLARCDVGRQVIDNIAKDLPFVFAWATATGRERFAFAAHSELAVWNSATLRPVKSLWTGNSILGLMAGFIATGLCFAGWTVMRQRRRQRVCVECGRKFIASGRAKDATVCPFCQWPTLSGDERRRAMIRAMAWNSFSLIVFGYMIGEPIAELTGWPLAVTWLLSSAAFACLFAAGLVYMARQVRRRIAQKAVAARRPDRKSTIALRSADASQRSSVNRTGSQGS